MADKPFVCLEPSCLQRFATEDHLNVHQKKHELNLTFSSSKTPGIPYVVDQTPTPTKFLKHSDVDAAVFENPFDMSFKSAHLGLSSPSKQASDSLHTPTPSFDALTPGATPSDYIPGPYPVTENTTLDTPVIDISEKLRPLSALPDVRHPKIMHKKATRQQQQKRPASLPISKLAMPSKIPHVVDKSSSQESGSSHEDVVTPVVEETVCEDDEPATVPMKVIEAPEQTKQVTTSTQDVLLSTGTATVSPTQVLGTSGVPVAVQLADGSSQILLHMTMPGAAHHVITSQQHVISSQPHVISGQPHVISGQPHVISGQPHVMGAAPQVILPLVVPVSQPSAPPPAPSRPPDKPAQGVVTIRAKEPAKTVPEEPPQTYSRTQFVKEKLKQSLITSTQQRASLPVSVLTESEVNSTSGGEAARQAAESSESESAVTTQAADSSSLYGDGDDEAKERRQQFLQRNKQSAARCREKKKMQLVTLQKKVSNLQEAMKKMASENRTLQYHNKHLKALLVQHKDCPVTKQQQASGEFQRFAALLSDGEPPAGSPEEAAVSVPAGAAPVSTSEYIVLDNSVTLLQTGLELTNNVKLT